MISQSRAHAVIIVVDLYGSLTLGVRRGRLKQTLSLRLPRCSRLVLNFRGVDALDCSGIGELVESHLELERAGGQLKLVDLRPEHRRMISVVGLVGPLDIGCEEDALVALAEAPGADAYLERWILNLSSSSCSWGSSPVVPLRKDGASRRRPGSARLESRA